MLGVRVDDVTYDEALAVMEGLVGGQETHLVVTVNPELLMAAQSDESYKEILNQASLSLPDGIGLLWGSQVIGQPLRQRVAGVDTVERLAALSARKGYRLFFLGAAPGVAQEAANRLGARYPGLQVVGTYAGSPSADEEPEILNRIGRARPDFLLVAYGAPKQEEWIHRNRKALGVAVAMGVGGSFDFISGRAVRAPGWMQRIGLEWLHRLYREPWRWRRMMALPRFAWAVLVEGISSRFGRR
jgi:N-acetylglucosaminyldiphosphoundecaprenol N-acetyl-beta-D-mannosaminyltransferase